MIVSDYSEKVRKLFKICHKKQLKIRTSESCTGGALAFCFTHLPGSSDYFDRGVVTYSNNAKETLLNIDPFILDTYGAVSFETALLMANNNSGHNIISIATTGILGPKGDGHTKKVGEVYIAINYKEESIFVKKLNLKGKRASLHSEVLKQAIDLAMPCRD